VEVPVDPQANQLVESKRIYPVVHVVTVLANKELPFVEALADLVPPVADVLGVPSMSHLVWV